MPKVSLFVPAKAMLFGEYGVLYGGKAIAVTFFEHYFLIHLNLSQSSGSGKIHIQSSFFKENTISIDINNFDQESTNSNICFFKNLLKPWISLLNSKDISIVIEKSFSPSHGFGSSSALIAAISKGLWTLFFKDRPYFNNEEFWKFIRNSLTNIQGSGSGYDIAVQLTACQSNMPKENTEFWIFQNQNNSSIPIVENFIPKEPISKYGSFISTRIYSDTTKYLRLFLNNTKKEEFSLKHSQLANEFIKDSSLENLTIIMGKARCIAVEQGLIPNNNAELEKTINLLNKNNIPYKTMGAGHGDCLWILADTNTIVNKCKIQKSDIPFVFKKSGTSI